MAEGEETSHDTVAFERLLAAARREHYVLHLYVSGMSPRSTAAIHALRGLCDELLRDSYSLEITDIYEHRQVARDHQIVVAPTLVRQSPLPVRRLVGDLSDRNLVLRILDLGR